MSNHELDSGHSYQPDQPYSELDDRTKTVLAAIADGRTESPQELSTEFALMERLLARLIEAEPGLDLSPGLPPKLLELWRQEDEAAGNTPPPDAAP